MNPRSAFAHYDAARTTSVADLARTLRLRGTALLAEAERIESGSAPSPSVIRSDVHEVELAVVAYDKANSAREAALVTAQDPLRDEVTPR